MRAIAILCALSIPLVAPPQEARAQGNVVQILQESSSVFLPGNFLELDQSQALSGRLLGADPSVAAGAPLDFSQLALDPAYPALQRGSGNRAAIAMSGEGAQIHLLQSSGLNLQPLSDPAAAYNRAVVSAQDSAFGVVLQRGVENFASLDLAREARGVISQNGANLSANLIVGPGSSGEILQNGLNNRAMLDVSFPGASVSYVQNGTGLDTGDLPVQVITSTHPETISVIQTGF